MTQQDKIIVEAKKWLGYEEKDMLLKIGKSMDEPEQFKGNGIYNNFTIFAKEFTLQTGQDYQGQPWCATFVCAVFIKALGFNTAKKLLKSFEVWTPALANCTNTSLTNMPQVGGLVFFRNSKRIHHVEIVYKFDNEYVYTIGGNTRISDDVISEGHIVTKKMYKRKNSSIAGFSLISFEDDTALNGWYKNSQTYSYYHENKKLTSGIYSIDGLLYLFDKKGVMCTGQHFIHDQRHYFDKVNGWELKITDNLPTPFLIEEQ